MNSDTARTFIRLMEVEQEQPPLDGICPPLAYTPYLEYPLRCMRWMGEITSLRPFTYWKESPEML